MNRGVIDNIVIICHLHQDLKTDRLPGDPFCELVVEVIWTLALCCSLIQILVACVGRNPVSSVAANAILVGKTIGCYAKVGLFCKAGRCGLRRLHERKRLWMVGEERFDWSWRGLLRAARGHSPQKLQKLLPGPGWESIGRMADNICMHVLSEIEPQSKPARICIGVIVRDKRQPCGA